MFFRLINYYPTPKGIALKFEYLAQDGFPDYLIGRGRLVSFLGKEYWVDNLPFVFPRHQNFYEGLVFLNALNPD